MGPPAWLAFTISSTSLQAPKLVKRAPPTVQTLTNRPPCFTSDCSAAPRGAATIWGSRVPAPTAAQRSQAAASEPQGMSSSSGVDERSATQKYESSAASRTTYTYCHFFSLEASLSRSAQSLA